MIKELNIKINSKNAIDDLVLILNNSVVENRNEYTAIKLFVDDNTIELPKQYYITDIELNRIKNTYGVEIL